MFEKSLLNEKEVLRFVGKSRATLSRWVRTGLFPSPRQIGPNTKAWLTSDVEQWLQSRRAVHYDVLPHLHEIGSRIDKVISAIEAGRSDDARRRLMLLRKLLPGPEYLSHTDTESPA